MYPILISILLGCITVIIYSIYQFTKRPIKLIDSSSDLTPKQNSDSLQTMIPDYKGPNPWHRKPLRIIDKLKIFLFTVTGIAPMRYNILL